tara:strand:+ start:12992 stop:13144 length:153 start_codon:yes stop_codon:yes gene_type:complete
MLLLYTEKQLKEAYEDYIQTQKEFITLENFRSIFETYWKAIYEQKGRTKH